MSAYFPSSSVAERTCLEEVVKMPNDSEVRSLATSHGLNFEMVNWEANARKENSSWGPCISDMTLAVEGLRMPLIKASSNFVDECWDVEIEIIPLVVGNQEGTKLYTVTLKEYLQNFRDYLHDPSSWKGDKKSLLRDDDTHVICSAQACFLPLPKEGDAKFEVSIYNNQSSYRHPAVLAIVASASGTSAEILEGRQNLFHNKNGEKVSFVCKRSSQHHLETGSELSSDVAMASSEKQQNMLLIIQVPLVRRNVRCYNFVASKKSSAPPTVGASHGKHQEIHRLPIERDDRFPIRVTLQYYQATSNGAVNDEVLARIHEELQGARKETVAFSSTVTETTKH